jgi:hypothetical protein
MNFAAIDFETAKYSRESACSVGLVKFLDGKAAEIGELPRERECVKTDICFIHW